MAAPPPLLLHVACWRCRRCRKPPPAPAMLADCGREHKLLEVLFACQQLRQRARWRGRPRGDRARDARALRDSGCQRLPDLGPSLAACVRAGHLVAELRGACREPPLAGPPDCAWACRRLARLRRVRCGVPPHGRRAAAAPPRARRAPAPPRRPRRACAALAALDAALARAPPCGEREADCVDKEGLGIRFSNRTPAAAFFAKSYGSWEPALFPALAAALAPSSTLLDAGAWVGPATLWAGHLARRVVALEPSPEAAAMLRANLEHRAGDEPEAELARRVRPLELALGAADGEGWVTNLGNSMDRLTAGGWPEAAAAACASAPCARVAVRSIEGLVRLEPAVAAADVVKIDIEGHEADVLPALRGFLLRRRPTLLLSLHLGLASQRLGAAVAVLQEICPYLYALRPSGLRPWRPLPPAPAAAPGMDEAEAPDVDVWCSWAPPPRQLLLRGTS